MHGSLRGSEKCELIALYTVFLRVFLLSKDNRTFSITYLKGEEEILAGCIRYRHLHCTRRIARKKRRQFSVVRNVSFDARVRTYTIR